MAMQKDECTGARKETESAEEARPHSARERRSEHRVRDDQRSGQGVLTAVSRLNMLERRKKMWRAVRGQPLPETPR